MAIIYNYPLNSILLAEDMLIGTSTKIVNGQPKNATKNFSIADLTGFIKQNVSLDDVLLVGNTSLLDAKIGRLYLYDTPVADYGNIALNQNRFSFNTVTHGEVFRAQRDMFSSFSSSGYRGSFEVSNITANRVWDFPDKSGTVALLSDVPVVTIPTLQQVTDEGNTTSNDIIVSKETGASYIHVENNNNALTLQVDSTFGTYIELNDANNNNYGALSCGELLMTSGNSSAIVQLNAEYFSIQTAGSKPYIALNGSDGILTGSVAIKTDLIDDDYIQQLPNASGTLALTSDIPTLTSELTNDVPFLTQDNVVEYPNLASFPVTGVIGTIYIALDTGLFYSWSGLAYVLSSPPNTGITGVGLANYVGRWTSPTTMGTGVIRDDGSNVGINTSPNASYRLSVNGNANISNFLYANVIQLSNAIIYDGGGNLGSRTRGGRNVDYFASGNISSHGNITFSDGNRLTSGTETARFDTYDRRLGIRTTTPTEALDVNGNIRNRGFYYDENNSAGTSGQILSSTATGTDWINLPASGVTSVGLTMPSAFSVTNSPITSSGDISVTGAGLASQYIRGDGTLATLPTSASGGSSISYYLNGGTAASVATYFQMSKIAVIGTGVDFSLAGNGLISQWLTDVADPNRLEIPAGNWNFEMYMSASSSGGTPAFYVELLKYDGVTFTTIANSSAVPEAITSGTLIDLYLTSLAIPYTALTITDRLAVRVYIVNSTGGRTITMHTQDSHLCQIITNFAGGIAALNGLSANTQYFDVGTGATNFNISSSGDTHTFNLLFNIRRNANNSSNNNINYNGYAVTGSAESSAVWTITRLTIAASGSITVATATNVAWINRESATYI